MARSPRYVASVVLVGLSLLSLSVLFFMQQLYTLLSLTLLTLVLAPVFVRFERRELSAREVILLALLAALAAVSRVPFASLPSVQPTSFIVIMTGVVFGAESGFIVGAVAALVSNMFLGQGPWTPWQMVAWALMGLSAGLLRKTRFLSTVTGKVCFGLSWGFLFGWFMNAWVIVGQLEHLSLAFIGGILLASAPFDLAHGLANGFFLLVFSNAWLKILRRMQIKYGLLHKK